MDTKKTIVFIDDNPDFLSLTEEELAADEYAIKTVLITSSVNALEEVKKCTPDIIFLDVLFSKKFSNSLASEIRHDPQLRTIPVYLMSFLDIGEIEMIANKEEVNGCFMKPITQEDLVLVFKKHFNIILVVKKS